MSVEVKTDFGMALDLFELFSWKCIKLERIFNQISLGFGLEVYKNNNVLLFRVNFDSNGKFISSEIGQ